MLVQIASSVIAFLSKISSIRECSFSKFLENLDLDKVEGKTNLRL